MERILLKSKVHRCRVTETNLEYEGSLSLDQDLMEAANICAFEQVHIYNISNGHRFVTYAIPGRCGSGQVSVNGAAARLAQAGDLIIVATYASYPDDEVKDHEPTVVKVDNNNRVR